jgi:uncharacterized protein (TIGR03000 family)
MFRQRMNTVTRLSVGAFSLALILFLGTAQAAPESGNRPKPISGGIETNITMRVPPGAVIWVDGIQTKGQGAERRFVTPPMAPGKYYYEVKAAWIEGGRSVAREHHLSFRAGDRVVYNFAPNFRLQQQQGMLMDPAAPQPWRTNYNNNPLNWPNFPNYRQFNGYYPMMPMYPPMPR